MIVFSGTLKLAILAAYSQQNRGRGTANSDAFVVSAMSNLNNICTWRIGLGIKLIIKCLSYSRLQESAANNAS